MQIIFRYDWASKLHLLRILFVLRKPFDILHKPFCQIMGNNVEYNNSRSICLSVFNDIEQCIAISTCDLAETLHKCQITVFVLILITSTHICSQLASYSCHTASRLILMLSSSHKWTADAQTLNIYSNWPHVVDEPVY